MADALFDLEDVLKCRKEKLTLQEERVLETWKYKALWRFTSGVFGSATVAWAATWKLNLFARAIISVGAADFFGSRGFNKSLDSSVDHILAMDGSRMQKELANILAGHMTMILTMSPTVTLISKGLMWNPRKFLSIQGFRPGLGISRCTPMAEEMNLGSKVMEDPLESIFGFTSPVEEIHHPGASGKPARALNRSHKRSRRSRRMHHQEASLYSERLQPQQI